MSYDSFSSFTSLNKYILIISDWASLLLSFPSKIVIILNDEWASNVWVDALIPIIHNTAQFWRRSANFPAYCGRNCFASYPPFLPPLLHKIQPCCSAVCLSRGGSTNMVFAKISPVNTITRKQSSRILSLMMSRPSTSQKWGVSITGGWLEGKWISKFNLVVTVSAFCQGRNKI